MKKQTINRGKIELSRQRALLVALSDDLTLPFLQIKTSLEQIEADNFSRKSLRPQALNMNLSIETGLQLVEAYRLLLMSAEIDDLPMHPLSIGAVLEHVAHKISPYAKQYSTKIEVNVQGRLAPVLAYEPILNSALEVLSASLIRAQSAQTAKKEYRLVLGAHKSGGGVVAAGVFSETHGLSDKTLRAARSLIGQARQPITAIPAGAASGVLVADMLCSQMWQPLRSAAHHNMGGLATLVPASNQLQFV